MYLLDQLYLVYKISFINFNKSKQVVIEEFKKDVEYRYSLDGWIGRIFIEPIENFIDWLKK